MRVRRCSVLMIEPRERLEFDLSRLSAGTTGLHAVIEWIALAPHAGEVSLTSAQIVVLGAVSPSCWTEFAALAKQHPTEVLKALIEIKMLIEEGSDVDASDQRLRDVEWRPASAIMHYASRWRGADTEELQQRFIDNFESDLLDRLGPAPPPVGERSPASERLNLPPVEPTLFGKLLDGRVTCRNFDCARSLTLAQFAAVLFRTYGARAVDDYAPGVQLLKKGVPSAGGLHPTEAYLAVQQVDEIAPGLYHYHSVEHALEPIRFMPASEVRGLARQFVGAQSYLVDAQAFVIPVSRFRRNFWKYRNHAKAYRALILDVGHLSQTMYLAATELGLAAFITAAINEVDIEQAFGLDPLEEGPLAVCGFGIRATERNEIEFDPLKQVWPDS